MGSRIRRLKQSTFSPSQHGMRLLLKARGMQLNSTHEKFPGTNRNAGAVIIRQSPRSMDFPTNPTCPPVLVTDYQIYISLLHNYLADFHRSGSRNVFIRPHLLLRDISLFLIPPPQARLHSQKSFRANATTGVRSPVDADMVAMDTAGPRARAKPSKVNGTPGGLRTSL